MDKDLKCIICELERLKDVLELSSSDCLDYFQNRFSWKIDYTNLSDIQVGYACGVLKKILNDLK